MRIISFSDLAPEISGSELLLSLVSSDRAVDLLRWVLAASSSLKDGVHISKYTGAARGQDPHRIWRYIVQRHVACRPAQASGCGLHILCNVGHVDEYV